MQLLQFASGGLQRNSASPEILPGIPRGFQAREQLFRSRRRASSIRHKTLPESLLVRIKIIYRIFQDVLDDSLEQTIDGFRRDSSPENEVQVWEKAAGRSRPPKTQKNSTAVHSRR
jgi:hypothetical protein